MLDQVMEIYEIVTRFVWTIDISGSLDEIAGGLGVILLLLIARRIRKARKQKKSLMAAATSGGAQKSSDTETDTTDETTEDNYGDIAPVAEPEELEPSIEPPLRSDSEPAVERQTDDITAEKKALKEEAGLPSPEKPGDAVGFFDRLKSGLSKTRKSLSSRFDSILAGNRAMNDDVLEEIEEALITSDIGVPTTMELMQRIEKKADRISSADTFKSELKKEMRSLIDIDYRETIFEKPHVIMIVGVNGVGKTTTIGKLAAQYAAQGKKVLLSASDTFRAAAVEQLDIWAERSGADIVRHRDKSDPAAVAFDSVEAAIARDIDVVIVDTAGRLHTKVNLMEELKKIKRSIGKKVPSAPHDTFLVVDATTGQNAVSQAKLFNENIDITGIILTKLDGTAKGGIVLSICNSLNVPIRYIGIGEKIDDLQKFDPKLFVDALL